MALGRKNALFAGADSGGKHWAIVATLIQTAKLNTSNRWGGWPTC
jgi:transposase